MKMLQSTLSVATQTITSVPPAFTFTSVLPPQTQTITSTPAARTITATATAVSNNVVINTGEL